MGMAGRRVTKLQRRLSNFLLPPEIPLSPEERLLLAIFDRALRDFARIDTSIKQEERRTAELYFTLNDVSLYGTFAHLCHHFDRDHLEALKKPMDANRVMELYKQTKSKGTYTKWEKGSKKIGKIRGFFRKRRKAIIDQGRKLK